MGLRSIATNRFALVVYSIVFSLLLTVAADRSVGYLFNVPKNLVFNAYSVVNYTTSEFHVQARINNLGFRGRDVVVRGERRYRIVTLGDSFTFGWGVDTNDTWSSVLEKASKIKGWMSKCSTSGGQRHIRLSMRRSRRERFRCSSQTLSLWR